MDDTELEEKGIEITPDDIMGYEVPPDGVPSLTSTRKQFWLLILLYYVIMVLGHYFGGIYPSLGGGYWDFLFVQGPGVLIAKFFLWTLVLIFLLIIKGGLDKEARNQNEENKIRRKATTFEEREIAEQKIKQLKKMRSNR